MKRLFTDTIPVRARDIDIFDHVNNSLYLTYMEETRWNWFIDCGFREKYKDGLAIVEARIEFKRPIKYPNDVYIESFAHPPGRSSFTIHHKLSVASDKEKICTEADIKVVCFNMKTQKPIEIPDYFRAILLTSTL